MRYRYVHKKEVELPIYKVVYNGMTFVLKLQQLLEEHDIGQREIENFFKGNEVGEVHRSFLYRLTSGNDLNTINLTQALLVLVYLREKTGKDLQLNDLLELAPVEPVEE